MPLLCISCLHTPMCGVFSSASHACRGIRHVRRTYTWSAQGWIIFRSKEYLPDNLVFHDSYLGIDQISFTLNFSKRCSVLFCVSSDAVEIVGHPMTPGCTEACG